MRTGLFPPISTPPMRATWFIKSGNNFSDVVKKLQNPERHAMIRGWNKRYSAILKEFGYSRDADKKSAVLLESILKNRNKKRNNGNKNYTKHDTDKKINSMIKDRTVFVVGAGPSLSAAIPILKACANRNIISNATSKRRSQNNKGSAPVTCIVAGSSVRPLVDNAIIPDIVVTDLDGDDSSLAYIAKNYDAVFVVHAHADNIERLGMATQFKHCIGTTQAEPFGIIQNPGGFTDGDRAVFLASMHGAGRIILFGMDFGNRIGRWSCTKRSDRQTKLKKLSVGSRLLEWLSAFTGSKLYTTSRQIPGFEKVSYKQLGSMISLECI